MTDQETIEKLTRQLERARDHIAEASNGCCCEWGDCGLGNDWQSDQMVADINSTLSKIPGPRPL